jgi:hypothetical protein
MARAILTENYPVLETCKEDMIEEFVASPKIRLEIEQFTDNQMRTIAEKLGAVLLDGYWAALRDAVEEELCKR